MSLREELKELIKRMRAEGELSQGWKLDADVEDVFTPFCKAVEGIKNPYLEERESRVVWASQHRELSESMDWGRAIANLDGRIEGFATAIQAVRELVEEEER